jgi:cytoplasmic iron level regulating protein YaaA (DUF328/UPF0246 family)
MTKPQLLQQATQLDEYLKTLSVGEIAKAMHISSELAQVTQQSIFQWSDEPAKQSLAIDSFIGDIYSGLHAGDLSKDDRGYANKTLRILSGLYGILRPYDGIMPYRLEMGYKLPAKTYANLYKFWGTAIADTLPSDGVIVNTSSVEYTKAVLPFVDEKRVITPQFLSVDPKTKEPTFKVVHAKIARGAFARWLIETRITEPSRFKEFINIGYQYNAKLSKPHEPTFVCEEFGGKGLSIRLPNN